MNTKFYINLLNKYQSTGKIGNIKPINLEHAQKIAYRISTKQKRKTTNG